MPLRPLRYSCVLNGNVFAGCMRSIYGIRLAKVYVESDPIQFLVADHVDHSATKPVFNRGVTLKDSWVK